MRSTLKRSGINILDIFFCPHSSSENCECKKPKNAMFEEALSKYQMMDRDKSIMIGDSTCDKVFAEKSALRFYGIKGGSLLKQNECYESIESISKKVI